MTFDVLVLRANQHNGPLMCKSIFYPADIRVKMERCTEDRNDPLDTRCRQIDGSTTVKEVCYLIVTSLSDLQMAPRITKVMEDRHSALMALFWHNADAIGLKTSHGADLFGFMPPVRPTHIWASHHP
jgi:hypothetical protein